MRNSICSLDCTGCELRENCGGYAMTKLGKETELIPMPELIIGREPR